VLLQGCAGAVVNKYNLEYERCGMKNLIATLAILCLSYSFPAHAEFRIWEGTSGNVIEAEFVTVLGNEAVLRKRDGETVKVPISKLCEEDQQYIKSREQVAHKPKQSTEAKVHTKYKFTRFRKGSNVYLDRAAQFYSIPVDFNGYKVTLRSIGSPSPLIFKVTEAGIVRLLAAGPPARKLRNEGWVEISIVKIASQDGHIQPYPIFIFEKKLDVGKYSIASEGYFGVRLLK